MTKRLSTIGALKVGDVYFFPSADEQYIFHGWCSPPRNDLYKWSFQGSPTVNRDGCRSRDARVYIVVNKKYPQRAR